MLQSEWCHLLVTAAMMAGSSLGSGIYRYAEKLVLKIKVLPTVAWHSAFAQLLCFVTIQKNCKFVGLNVLINVILYPTFEAAAFFRVQTA
jgi:hypothetical protein